MLQKLLNELSIKVTLTTLEADLVNHPYYPKLVSLTDVLTNYGVHNITFKTTLPKLDDMPLPFLAVTKSEHQTGEILALVLTVEDKHITYFDPESERVVSVTKDKFSGLWPSGLVVIMDAEQGVDEINYHGKRAVERRSAFAASLYYLAVPVLAVLAAILSFIRHGLHAFWPVLYLLVTLAGAMVGCLLLLHEIGAKAPLLQQICSSSKKINCDAVLQSKAASIAGISWGVIGFTYFTGCVLPLVFIGLGDVNVLCLLAWLNVLAMPYVVFSIYYQWRVVQQWCVLCLSVQAVLILQFGISLAAGLLTLTPFSKLFTAENMMHTALFFLITFVIINALIPSLKAARQNKLTTAELQRMKHNPEIFRALLLQQKAMAAPAGNLGIVLGNPSAPNKIVKVCNPYCGPCAKAHAQLEQLVHNNPAVQLQIIFTASSNENDFKTPPVRHLLAIAEDNEEPVVKGALNDWYLAKEKNYQVFANKYPIAAQLLRQDGKIEAMQNWCEQTQISYTPTIFVNGQQLPEMYTVEDLKYFFPFNLQ